MLTRLIQLANLADELGFTTLANETDALLAEAATNPYAYDPRNDQAVEDRSGVLHQVRREVKWKLEHAVRDMDKSPFAVFSIRMRKKEFGPYMVEYLEPHAELFTSREAAEHSYRAKEHVGREGYVALQRRRDTIKSSGDRELVRDVLHARPEIVG